MKNCFWHSKIWHDSDQWHSVPGRRPWQAVFRPAPSSSQRWRCVSFVPQNSSLFSKSGIFFKIFFKNFNFVFQKLLLKSLPWMFFPCRLIAGKSHYFGLDGGTDAFRDAIKEQSLLAVVSSKEYPDSVRREILTVNWKKWNIFLCGNVIFYSTSKLSTTSIVVVFDSFWIDSSELFDTTAGSLAILWEKKDWNVSRSDLSMAWEKNRRYESRLSITLKEGNKTIIKAMICCVSSITESINQSIDQCHMTWCVRCVVQYQVRELESWPAPSPIALVYHYNHKL